MVIRLPPLIPVVASAGCGFLLALLTGCGGGGGGDPVAATAPMDTREVSVPVVAPALASRAELGRQLFHDPALSEPAGTSCATCHDPKRGFVGNNGGTSVALGSAGQSGLRNTPTAAYASFTPPFSIVPGRNGPEGRGGQFHDGRADTLAPQALGPFLATAEMNNPSAAAVVTKVAASTYAPAFRAAFGQDIFTRPDAAFTAIGQAIEAYERTGEFRSFTSRYDDLLRGNDTFTAAERRGMDAFFSRAKGDCASCHRSDRTNPNPAASLFTDHSYVALGVPRNPAIPANADPTFFDLGLAGPQRTSPAGLTRTEGLFKVPTLRNVALKTSFMHNGRFTTLTDVVGFYATRDIDPRRWYPNGISFNDLPAQFRGNVTRRPPFDLAPGARPRLTPGDVSDIVAFLGTLSDAPAVAALVVAQ